MRVFCPEHKRGFFAPRQSPIKCENHGHVLGELDFTGEAKSSLQLQWQYCCNCEHFSLIEFDEHGFQRCPVCNRRSSILYLCDRCYTVSFESNTPLQTKNFTLTSEGSPQPCCPGCLQSPSADLREHNCDDLGAAIVTALNVCPLCGERLDIGPAFPSLVADYLRKTKSANKLIVTFDYESGLFVPVDDGEFVLVTNSDENARAVVLPRSPRLATLRDFYELYQDYYHCARPDAGDVNVIEPAVVVPMMEGWKVLTSGVFEVVSNHPEKKAPAIPMPQPTKEPLNVDARRPDVKIDESVAPCSQCGALIESKYAYCWECGNPREPKNEPLVVRPKPPRLIVSTVEPEDDEEHTVQHEPRSARSELFSWASTEKPERHVRPRGSVLKLFSIAGGGLLLSSLALFALWPSSSKLAPNAAPQYAAPTVQTNPTPAASGQVTRGAEIKPASLQAPTTNAEDTALAQLRQMRSAASDRLKVLETLSKTEMKYADDYRFPYERARMAVVDHEKNFHEEAFAALARAAQKAINKGNAGEMLQSLNKDSDGDFHRLSHGHPEWTQLQKALKSKDVSVLSANEGL